MRGVAEGEGNMRRLLRWAFNGAAVVSAVLFAAVCVLWVRSSSINDAVRWQRGGDGTIETWWLNVVNGRVGLSGKRVLAPGLPVGSDLSWCPTPLRQSQMFRWNPDQAFPVWHLMVYTGVLPLWWVVRRHYSTLTHRRRHGLCPSCGYDLRATPDRCPECGTIPVNGKAAT
jgi:hypothetical protein